MADKKNTTAVATENEEVTVTETETAVETETTVEKTAVKLIVERMEIKDKNGRQYQTRDGRDYFAYILRGKILGRETKVDFTPADKGGYEALNFVYAIAPTAELEIRKDRQRNKDTGETKIYTSYIVFNVSENGKTYSASVRPKQKSDEDLLNMLLEEMR